MLSKIFWGVVTLSLAIYVCWMVTVSVKDVFKAHAAKDWPTTIGVVVSSEVVRPGNGKSYTLKILYQYSVGMTSYVGNRLTFGFVLAGGGSKSEAQALANQYPVKVSVTVHYNPEAPSEAVIVPQVSNETWWFIFTMPFGIAIVIFVSWSFFHSAWIAFSQGRNLQ